jgi:membrane protein DedA with SNARE-associated domain
MSNFIYNLMQQIDSYPQWLIYSFTYISGLLQVAFPPYPGEIVVVLAGCLKSNSSIIHGLTLFLTYWASILLANSILYELGRCKGAALLNSRLFSKLIKPDSKDKIAAMMDKYGFFIFLAAIYMPGMYLPLVFFSGVLKHDRRIAYPGIMIATFVHDIILFIGGWAVGNNINDISAFMTTYKTAALCIVSVIIAFAGSIYFIKNRQRRKEAIKQ